MRLEALDISLHTDWALVFSLAAPQEQSYYDRLFSIVDKESLGLLTGENAFDFLLSSKLPQRNLGEIWALSDPNNTGYLTKDQWWRCCRLIGHAQKQPGAGEVKEEWANQAGPYPRFEGHPPPPPASLPASAAASQRMGSLTPQGTGAGAHNAPTITPADRAQFTRVFVGAQPVSGLLTGPQAQGIFLKSQLPVEVLASVWNLADTQQRGALDLPDFIIGMAFIQALMRGQISKDNLPTSLPHGLYEQASGGRPRPQSPAPTSPIARQMTGGGAASPGPMGRQMTGSGLMQPQLTGQSAAAGGLGSLGRGATGSPARQFSNPPATSAGSAFGQSRSVAPPAPWDVQPAEKNASDGFFDTLDPARRGFIEGDVAVPFMLQSGLDESTLAQVWDLADIRKEGKLSKDEFAVAMHLINARLAGRDVPQTLPTSLVPPSLRELVANQTGGQQGGVSETTRDLFDVFADSPPASAAPQAQAGQSYFAQQQQQQQPSFGVGANNGPSSTTATAPASRAMSPAATGNYASPMQGQDQFGMSSFAAASMPKPVNDLMGDDDDQPLATASPAVRSPPAPATRSIPDDSAEIAKHQSSIDETTKAMDGLKVEREGLERDASNASAQVREIEMRLSSIKAQHGTETKHVNDLKTRNSEQKAQIEKLRQELIQSESELSALRAEKDEIEQQLLTDKEEVRGMGKRMKEVTEETEKLKAVLEKMKKEARQQRGMVAISKKQVTSLETSRDAVQQEMDDVAAGRGLGHEIEEPFAGEGVQPRSDPVQNTAAAIPLPSTPRGPEALSPTPTGGSNKSNNPFERFNRAAPPPPPAARGLPETQEHAAVDEPHLTTMQTATLGAGGLATAGALAAGGLGGAALVGAGTALAVGAEKSAEHQNEVPEQAGGATPTADTLPAAVTESQAQPEDLDPFGAPAQDDVTSRHALAASPAENAARAAHSNDAEDPFGKSTSNATQDAFGAAGQQATDDPFGMPSFENTSSTAPAAPTFDDAFGGDDFAATPVTREAAPDAPLETASSGQQPTADMHLAPATEPVDTDFDKAFDDFDKPAASAIPPEMRPVVPERTLSTQASPPSEVHTPGAEMPPSATPFSVDVDEPVAPVNPEALVPQEQPEPAIAAAAAAPAADAESSDDEDDGPEDLERSKSPFAARSAAVEQQEDAKSPFDGPDTNDTSLASSAHSAGASQQGYASFPPLQTYGTGSELEQQSAPEAQSRTIDNTGDGPRSLAQSVVPAEPPIASPTSVEKQRREPPPPPPARPVQSAISSPTATSQPSTNPFAMFTGAGVNDFMMAPPTSTAATSTQPAPATQPATTAASSGFDDDDFEFENLPSVNVGQKSATTTNTTSVPAAGNGRSDFDDDFDDFSPDFEMVSAPSSNAQNSTPQSNQAAPQLAPINRSQTLSFEDAFLNEFDER